MLDISVVKAPPCLMAIQELLYFVLKDIIAQRGLLIQCLALQAITKTKKVQSREMNVNLAMTDTIIINKEELCNVPNNARTDSTASKHRPFLVLMIENKVSGAKLGTIVSKEKCINVRRVIIRIDKANIIVMCALSGTTVLSRQQ
jgi:hypothetical protein